MALLNLDLTGPLSIDVGYEWRVILNLPGNMVDSFLKGEIRDSYDGALLALFRTGQSVYDATQDRTRVPLTLSPQQTRNLPPTIGGFYVYDLRVQPGSGLARVLLAGKVHVNRVVTR